MTISCTFANAEETQVLFTDNRGDTYTVTVDWPGRFREQDNDGGGVVGFLSDGGVIGPYVAPEPGPGAPSLYAVAQISIADGAVSGFDLNSKFAGGFVLDVGSYYILFAEIQPDTSYLAKAYDGGLVRAFVEQANKFEDGFIISVIDAAGDPVDVPNLSLEIIRVN